MVDKGALLTVSAESGRDKQQSIFLVEELELYSDLKEGPYRIQVKELLSERAGLTRANQKSKF